MHTGKQKQMNASYQASLVNRHIRRFTGYSYSAFRFFPRDPDLWPPVRVCLSSILTFFVFAPHDLAFKVKFYIVSCNANYGECGGFEFFCEKNWSVNDKMRGYPVWLPSTSLDRVPAKSYPWNKWTGWIRLCVYVVLIRTWRRPW